MHLIATPALCSFFTTLQLSDTSTFSVRGLLLFSSIAFPPVASVLLCHWNSFSHMLYYFGYLNVHTSGLIYHLNAIIWFKLIFACLTDWKFQCNKVTFFFHKRWHHLKSVVPFFGHKKGRLQCGRTSCQAAQRIIELRNRDNRGGEKVPIFRLRKNRISRWCERSCCLMNL